MSDDAQETLPARRSSSLGFAGAIAGVGSGLTKVVVGYGFDTVKTRLQCAPPGMYRGPWDCFLKTVRNEGPLALYKGASSPAVGWAFIDASLIGSLHNFRLFLIDKGMTQPIPNSPDGSSRLTLTGHALAGLFAGWTSCIIAHPVDTVKVKLQLQMSRSRSERQYKGPIDCLQQILRIQGVPGLYRGFLSMLLFRSNFAFMFLSYELLLRGFRSLNGTQFEVSEGSANFLSGGLASFGYWAFAIGPDQIKNRILADDLAHPKYSASPLKMARVIYTEGGLLSFYKGMGPLALRAFPVNACAFYIFEKTLVLLGAEKTSH